MLGQPITPKTQRVPSVIPTPPYSGPQSPWRETPNGWKFWSAKPPSSSTQVRAHQVPPAPFPLSPTNHNGPYPPRLGDHPPASPVRRRLFPEAYIETSKSSTPSSSIGSSLDGSVVRNLATPPTSPIRASTEIRSNILRSSEPLFLPSTSDEESNPQPQTTGVTPSFALALARRPLQSGSRLDNVSVEVLGDVDDDEILQEISADQAREVSDAMKRANFKHPRKEDHSDDEEISYIGSIKNVKHQRGQAAKRHYTDRGGTRESEGSRGAPAAQRERIGDGICPTCGCSARSSGKVPISGTLPRKVQANAIREMFSMSLCKLNGRSWEDLAEKFGANRTADAERLRQWLRKVGVTLERGIRDGSI